jgi:hypothetical protein
MPSPVHRQSITDLVTAAKDAGHQVVTLADPHCCDIVADGCPTVRLHRPGRSGPFCRVTVGNPTVVVSTEAAASALGLAESSPTHL